MKRFVLFALAAGVAGALFLLLPSARLEAASKLDSYWNQTGSSYPAAQFTKPMSWAAGQYVVTGTTINGSRKSVSKTLLVRQEQGGWVIETSTISDNGQQKVTQMLITGFDQAMTTGDASGLDLVWIKTLNNNGKVTTISGAQLGFMKGLYKSAYENILSKPSGATDGGPVQVPAGSFAGTSSVKTTMKIMMSTIEVQTWLNPAVPVNGMVKSMTTDGKTVVELLSFGTDGVPQIQ